MSANTTIKSGYKQTEAGVIPEEWELAHLGDKAVKVGSGITPTGGARVYKSTGRPFVRSQNVGWGSLLMEDMAFIDNKTHESFCTTEIEAGDVFLNITGASIGRSALADARVRGGNVNQHVCIIRAKQTELDPRFLNYFLLSKAGQNQIDSFQAGGNRQGLNFGQIRSFLLPIPPLPEQCAVAAALSDVDALIASLDRLVSKESDLKQAAMQQLLSGERRLPGFTMNWNIKRLGEIAEIVNGGTPRTEIAEYWEGGILWCTPTDITATPGKYLSETARTISSEGLASCSASLVPPGSLLLCSRATIGELKIAATEVCTNQGFKSLICHSDVDNEFLYYLLLTMKSRIVEKAIGSTFLEISKKDTTLLEIRIPELDEQIAIATVLSDMDAEISALEARRDKTQVLRRGMMQELLTGKTRFI